GSFRTRTLNQNVDGNFAGSAVDHFLVAARDAVVAARHSSARAILFAERCQRAHDDLGGTRAGWGPGRHVPPDARSAFSVKWPHHLFLFSHSIVASQSDIRVSALDHRSVGMVAVDISYRGTRDDVHPVGHSQPLAGATCGVALLLRIALSGAR